MQYNKRKFNFIIFFTIFLICLTVGLGTADFDSMLSSDAERDDIIIEVEDSENKEDANIEEDNTNDDNTNLPTIDNNENTLNYQNIPKLTTTFNNAWVAWNYAINIDKSFKSSVDYDQIINVSAIDGIVKAKSTIDREIYNQLTKIYVKNSPETLVEALSFEVKKTVGYNFYNCFDMIEQKVFRKDQSVLTFDEYLEGNKCFTFDLPYVINKNTVSSISLINNYKKSYYEINMTLNSKSWDKYSQSIKAGIGLKEEPEIQEIVLTVKINKEYGTLISLQAKEKYKEVYTYDGIDINCDGNGMLYMEWDYFNPFDDKAEKIKEVINLNN